MSSNHWTKLKLGESLEALIDYRGKTPKKTEEGIPLITARIVKNGFIHEANEFIAEKDYDSWMVRGLPEMNDVVLTVEAPLGEVAQIKDKRVALAQRIVTLRGKEGVLDSGFLKYFLQSDIGQARLRERETGTTVTGIKQSELRLIEIDAPPFESQKKIASLLRSLDDKIEINRQINQTIEAIAKAIFKEWFVDFKHPGISVERGQSEVGVKPTNWKISSLSDVISVTHGFAFKGENFSDEETEDVLLTPGNFRIGGGFNYSKFKYYKGQYPNSYVLNKGEVIVTMTDLSKEGDTLGYSALVPEVPGKKLLHNQRIGRVIVKHEYLRLFVYLLMQQDNYRSFILGGATGSTVRHTSPSRICEYKFILPPTEILAEFEAILTPYLYLIEENHSQIQILAQLRDSLLPKLMNGEININASN
jgi:type I restriction enzyme, S subunit